MDSKCTSQEYLESTSFAIPKQAVGDGIFDCFNPKLRVNEDIEQKSGSFVAN